MASRGQQKEQARAARLAAEEADRREAQRKRHIQVGAIGGFALVVVIAIIAVTQAGSGDEPATGDQSATEVTHRFAGIPQDGTVLGDPKAPFTLTEVADLQCPFCAQYATDVLPRIVDDYVRAGKLKLDLKLLSFIGPDSETAARIALGMAPQERFWQFVDLFYLNQGAENSGYVTEDFMRGLADQIPGADYDEASAAKDSAQVNAQLTEAQTVAEDNGINSTPSFLIAAGDAEPDTFDLQSLDPGAFADGLDEYMATHN